MDSDSVAKTGSHYSCIRTIALAGGENEGSIYELLVLTYRTLEGTGPSYLQDIIELYKPKTSLVLRLDGRLDIPYSNLVSYEWG